MRFHRPLIEFHRPVYYGIFLCFQLMRSEYSQVCQDIRFLKIKKMLVSSYQLNAHLLYSITIYMLHYNPQHVSSSTLLIFRRTNCIITAHFLYSITIYMLHYNPKHVSSSTLLIFRRTNCITTASGIVALCKQPYSIHTVRLFTERNSRTVYILYSCLQRVTIPEAVIIQFLLLRMSTVLFETY